jgi:hypothetical protein
MEWIASGILSRHIMCDDLISNDYVFFLRCCYDIIVHN